MINRREYLKVLIILSVGIMLAACGSGIVSSPTGTEEKATTPSQVSDTPTQIPTIEPTEIIDTTQVTPSEPGIKIDPEILYKVSLNEITTDELLSKSNEELITLAPEIDPSLYPLEEVNTLSPISVVRVTDRESPFVIYVDENGDEIMIWEVESGDMLHSSVSVDVDTLGIPVRFHLATKESWIKQFGEYWTLDEKEKGTIAKVFAMYPMALNNFYTNHDARFAKLIRSRIDGSIGGLGHLEIDKLSRAEIDNINREAFDTLRSDITQMVQDQGEIKLKLGRLGKTVLDMDVLDGFDVFLTLEAGHKIAKRGYSIGPFKDFGWFNSFGGRNTALVEVKTDKWWLDKVIFFYPGGLLVGYLRETTALGGFSDRVESDFHLLASTTDKLIYDLCDNNDVNAYMQSVGGIFLSRGIVPVFDAWEMKYVPTELQFCSLKRVPVE